MEAVPKQQLTLILGSRRAGDEQARGEVVSLVYDELRRVASRLMRRERADHTLSPTAVVHEAVIRLMGEVVFEKAADRSYLFASAARAMREVLIDHARRRAADRRGGGRRRVPLDSMVDYFEQQGVDVVAVHEALDRLAELDGRQAQVMTLRYFGGMTVPEVAAGARGLGRDGGAGLATGAGLARRPARRERRMTPERWRQIGELFDAAVRIDPASRESWLRAACARGRRSARPRSVAFWSRTSGPKAQRALDAPRADRPPADRHGKLASPTGEPDAGRGVTADRP